MKIAVVFSIVVIVAVLEGLTAKETWHCTYTATERKCILKESTTVKPVIPCDGTCKNLGDPCAHGPGIGDCIYSTHCCAYGPPTRSYTTETGSTSCTHWCRTKGKGKAEYHCCDKDPVPRGADIHPGQCPEVREKCPPGYGGPPNECSSDGDCSNTADKCCPDACLPHFTCKPAVAPFA